MCREGIARSRRHLTLVVQQPDGHARQHRLARIELPVEVGIDVDHAAQTARRDLAEHVVDQPLAGTERDRADGILERVVAAAAAGFLTALEIPRRLLLAECVGSRPQAVER